MNIVIYQYQPEGIALLNTDIPVLFMCNAVPESQGGKHLVQRCDINAGAKINCLFRIKCKPSVSPLLSREIQVAVTERRHATYFGIDNNVYYCC